MTSAIRAAALAVILAQGLGFPRSPVQQRENAYRANNVGVARLEQFDFAAAAASFRRALEINPSLGIARLNLGIALFYGGQPELARKELEAARDVLPDRPHPEYMLGLAARAADRTDEAIRAFGRVRQIDPDDVGASVNLGQVYLQERRFSEALTLFRAAAKAEPYNVTAAYGLATALVRSGSPEGPAAMEHFQRLRESSYATTYSQNYLEQGRYAEALASTGAEPELVNAATPAVTFTDATEAMLPSPAVASGAGRAGVTLADLDGDGDLDLADASAAGWRVYRNDGGRLTQAASGPAASGVLAADYDNDTNMDLLVLRDGALSLLRQDAPLQFTDTGDTNRLRPPAGSARTAAWLDADHDGDLDLFVAIEASPAANRLYRNNGNGTFDDITAAAKIPSAQPLVAAVPTDYDNRRDIDLLFVPAAGRPLLYRNMRDGSFRDVAEEARLPVGAASFAAIGDINKDDYPDVYFAQPDGPGALALSAGQGRFRTEPAPAVLAGALAAHLLDYDSDGLLDIFAITGAGARVVRNVGGRWADVTSAAIAAPLASGGSAVLAMASGDLDGDGDVDVVVRRASGVQIWRNDGANRSRALAVRLAARISNRTAVGSKVEMRAGSLRQRMETYAASPSPAPAGVLFGFGDRPGADAVRVLWPSGILQTEVAAAGAPDAVLTGTLTVEELNRKPSSCPYLFTWNGERFEFLTDFLGGGEMGYWLAPGVRNSPDPDEYIRIPRERLRARNGRYEIRVTNELEEALFLDQLQLVVVEHRRPSEVYPNEGLRAAPEPLRIFSTLHPQPVLAARDDHGHDVLDRLQRVDRRYPDDFRLERLRGYAAEHSLTLTLPISTSKRRILLLTGWTDYAFSGDNVAAHQAGLKMVPPRLEIADASGRWRTAIENIGFPVGLPQTIPVDLSGLPRETRDVRIVTTMRVYWDEALVDVSDGRDVGRRTTVVPATATLRWRGFSAVESPDEREPYVFNYDQVSATSPWKTFPGRYTREGDVRGLLLRPDDRFVIARPGDEIAVAFDERDVPPQRHGWSQTFLLYANGFSKEMDLNSSSPDELLPLPFHGMKQYPYGPDQSYPSSPAHREYLSRYNTRVVRRAIPPIELQGPVK